LNRWIAEDGIPYPVYASYQDTIDPARSGTKIAFQEIYSSPSNFIKVMISIF
jgi:hypothetical protein